jgi:hypothetical protein
LYDGSKGQISKFDKLGGGKIELNDSKKELNDAEKDPIAGTNADNSLCKADMRPLLDRKHYRKYEMPSRARSHH